MPTMHDSNEGQTQSIAPERMYAAHARHTMRMMPPERQDEAIIRHYAACASLAMQGLRVVDARRAGQKNKDTDEFIKYIADMLKKAHLSDFGTTIINTLDKDAK